MFNILFKNGDQIMATTPSMAMLHWHIRTLPHEPFPKDVKPFEIVVHKGKTYSPYDPMFLPVVIGAIERVYGSAPEVPQELLDRKFGREDVNQICLGLSSEDSDVVLYENTCLELLRWLSKHGEFKKMEEKL